MGQVSFTPAGVAEPRTFRVVVAFGLAAVVGFFGAGCSEEPPAAPPPPKIPVVRVETQDVPVILEAVGQTVGSDDIEVRARVDGVLEEIHFREGLPVEKGQLLYSIDPTPFDARVRSAEGKVAEAKARFTSAESELARVRPLVEIDALSKRTLDAAVAEYEASKGLVQAAEADLENAKIERGYTEVQSPIEGLIGASEAYVGDYVGQFLNPVVLNTVSRLDPISVRFSISEREYLRYARRVVEQGKTMEEAAKEDEEELELLLADDTVHPHRGVVDFADRQINPETGTLLLEANFPNPDKVLRPGQFARVRAVVEMKKNATVVPQRAVVELQGIQQVYVVAEDGTVEVRRVTPGIKFDDMIQLDSGIEAGEWVAIEGMQRLRPGLKVDPAPASDWRRTAARDGERAGG